MKNRISKLVIAIAICALTQSASAGTIKGKVIAHGVKNAGDVVVYIDKIPGKTFSAPATHSKIDQRNMTFKPRVLAVLAGTTVDFLNSDDVLHNVYSPDKCDGKFNLGSWPKGQTKSMVFSNPGCFATLLCNVHPEMQGTVVVVETPYHAVTNSDGSYVIKGIPAGTYSLKIWHEKLHGTTQQVTVTDSGEIEVNFDIKR
jgi:plastocyanin